MTATRRSVPEVSPPSRLEGRSWCQAGLFADKPLPRLIPTRSLLLPPLSSSSSSPGRSASCQAAFSPEGTVLRSQWPSFSSRSRISQLNIPGFSRLYSSIFFSTSGVATCFCDQGVMGSRAGGGERGESTGKGGKKNPLLNLRFPPPQKNKKKYNKNFIKSRSRLGGTDCQNHRSRKAACLVLCVLPWEQVLLRRQGIEVPPPMAPLAFHSLTLGLLPPMAPGRMDPVSWYLQRILETQPWETRSCLEITQGLIPWCAISTILCRMWLGRGRPLMKTPPSWLTRPWPSGVETAEERSKA